ncbi:MAG: hypothetical protein ACI9DK_002677 [Vicingaceae bacterium]|jgi:hypothetical protein
MYLKVVISSLFLIVSISIQAQKKDTSQLKISAYVDSYMSSFSNDLNQQTFQPYTTAGARDNTFGVNVAQIGLHYTGNSIRGNFIYHDGDIPQATWSNNFNNLQEANAGFKLLDGLWLDMGFFATHIGTESFLPKENMLGQTSFITYNEPFYQAGAKLSYGAKNHWNFELWVANGYNRHVDNNDAKSVGVQVKKEFSKNTCITYSNMYGRESDDSSAVDQYRFYNNIYLNHNWKDKIYLTAGFDLGTQTNTDLSNADKTALMYAGLLTVRYQFTPKYSVTARGEFSEDENGFINGLYQTGFVGFSLIPVYEGISLYGITLGGEYKPNDNSYIRLDGRYLATGNNQNIFIENGSVTNERLEIMITIGFFIDKAFKI